MRYILLLRGVNVGGKNKVSMSELKNMLLASGFEDIDSYINSGNLFFTSLKKPESCISKIRQVLDTNYNRLHEKDGGEKGSERAFLKFTFRKKNKNSYFVAEESWKDYRLNPLTGKKE